MSDIYRPEGHLIHTCENREYLGSETMLARACVTGKILESYAVMCDRELNLSLQLPCMNAIIPKEEALYLNRDEEFKDIAVITRVGKPVCFKVLDITEIDGKRTAVLSRRAAQEECLKKHLLQKRAGDILECRVTRTESFGAFADVGCGVIALLPTDCISTSRICHPSDRTQAGESFRCVIKAIEKDSFRMFLSLKELLGTWDENAQYFSPGQTVSGIIRSIEDYGVFIELAPNLSALAEYREGCEVGMCASVYIKSMCREKMKIKLSIVDIFEQREKPVLKYFVSKDVNHIDIWTYSPDVCQKKIETVF